jgi:hypothetical protein
MNGGAVSHGYGGRLSAQFPPAELILINRKEKGRAPFGTRPQ